MTKVFVSFFSEIITLFFLYSKYDYIWKVATIETKSHCVRYGCNENIGLNLVINISECGRKHSSIKNLDIKYTLSSEGLYFIKLPL